MVYQGHRQSRELGQRHAVWIFPWLDVPAQSLETRKTRTCASIVSRGAQNFTISGIGHVGGMYGHHLAHKERISEQNWFGNSKRRGDQKRPVFWKSSEFGASMPRLKHECTGGWQISFNQITSNELHTRAHTQFRARTCTALAYTPYAPYTHKHTHRPRGPCVRARRDMATVPDRK